MNEAAGSDAPLGALADLDHVECNPDFCRWVQEGRIILASRGRDRVEGEEMARRASLGDRGVEKGAGGGVAPEIGVQETADIGFHPAVGD